MNLYFIEFILAVFAASVILEKSHHRGGRKKETDYDRDHFAEKNLRAELKKQIDEILGQGRDSLAKSGAEESKRAQQLLRLRKATREACLGDAGDREFLKEYIKELLQKKLKVNEQTILWAISFDDENAMSAEEIFEYLYMLFRRQYGLHPFRHMMEEFGWDKPRKDAEGRDIFEISEADVREALNSCRIKGAYPDRLEVLAQRCYEQLYGHDVADILIMDSDIDGVSGGVGGRTRIEYNYLEELMVRDETARPASNDYDVVYCVYHGRLIRMKFMSFGSSKVLERVVKNIYRYNSKTTLSKRNPVLNASMKNNSRVVVARPPVSDSWAFYVRKFASADARKIESLITDQNSEAVIDFLKRITSAELNYVVSGNTGGGKTTLVKSLIGYINPSYALRVIESSFELNINNLYPERNVHVMQERGDFTVYDAIAASKKMDTDVLILGEVNEPKIAGAFIQVAQSGSRMAITTLHHETTAKLIDYLRNALVTEFGINDVRIAEKQVVDSINFDIHMVHDVTGHHYIERITEIIPKEPGELPKDEGEATREFYDRISAPRSYELRDIFVFDKTQMCYRRVGQVSEKVRELIGEGSIYAGCI